MAGVILINYQNRLEYVDLLLGAQGWVCPLCGGFLIHDEGVLAKHEIMLRTSIDHVIPHSMGGSSQLGNLMLVHRGCNYLKADRAPTGCELIHLLAINCRLGVEPMRW